MSTVKMVALEPVNGHQPGTTFDVSEREAEQLAKKGLAKIAAPSNSTKAEGTGLAANPSKAAGKAAKSSASPAARASRKPTAKPSGVGSRKASTGKSSR